MPQIYLKKLPQNAHKLDSYVETMHIFQVSSGACSIGKRSCQPLFYSTEVLLVTEFLSISRNISDLVACLLFLRCCLLSLTCRGSRC